MASMLLGRSMRVSRCCSLVPKQAQRNLKTKASGLIEYDIPYEEFVTEKWPTRKFFDRTRWKLNENTKALAVEGGISVGKEHFAKELAAEFGLKYIRDTCDDDFWITKDSNPPVDFREYNKILPKNLQLYTVEDFFMDSDPKKNGRPIHLQHNFYMYRHYYWVYGIGYMFNTGRGIVSKNSPFSSIVFSQAMYEMGLCSKEAFDWLHYVYMNVMHYVPKPHLIVYLKGSVSQSRQAIQERNIPWEVNSPWFTDKFLETYKRIMEEDYLQRMAKYGEVIEIDLNELDLHKSEDAHFVAEEIGKLNLEYTSVQPHEKKFQQWRNYMYKPDAQDVYRAEFSNAKESMRKVYSLYPPRSMREAVYSVKDTAVIRELLSQDERLKQAGRNQSWMKWPKKQKNFLADWPKQHTIFKSPLDQI